METLETKPVKQTTYSRFKADDFFKTFPSEKIQAYKDFLTEKGSQVMVKNQGKRSLAYPIKNVETATAVQFVYLGNGELNKQLGVEIQRDEYVLRATTTKLMDESLSKLFA